MFQVWRYDEAYQQVEYGYPYHILDVFEGIPPYIDAAFDYTDGKCGYTRFAYSNLSQNVRPLYAIYINGFFFCRELIVFQVTRISSKARVISDTTTSTETQIPGFLDTSAVTSWVAESHMG